MIQIVGKGYKFILKQLDDFCGVANQIVISLKSAEGRKKYEEVFQRKIPEKVKNMKTRILSIFQTKLTDFSGKIIQKIAFQEYTNFHGYLGNLFMLNSSLDNYFLDLQLKLGYQPQQDTDFLNL